jgi:NADH:ubiquinone reductase (H+-translocating)
MENLVILGGGYGGMRILQLLLPNSLPEDINITLVDREPYHSLKTEFYSFVAGTSSDKHIQVPFPEHPQLQMKYGEIQSIDLEKKTVSLEGQDSLSYDYLVIGLGSEDNYHQIPGAQKHSLSIQTIKKSRKTYQTLNNLAPGSSVAIVGAGISGVQLASELAESHSDLEIFLYDRGKHILSSFPERLSIYVENWFDTNGVNIVNYANITQVEENTLFNHDSPIEHDAIVWTAGIQPSQVIRELPVEKDNYGRVVLTNQHNVPNYENVYVLGDCASLPYSPSAQLAEGQAEQIVEVLLNRWNGSEPPEVFPPIKLKGVLGSLGKKQGFGLLADRPITGRVARLIKSGILWAYKYHNG